MFSLQIPTGVPHPDTNAPLDLTDPAELIIYVIIPLLILILYLVAIKGKRKTLNCVPTPI